VRLSGQERVGILSWKTRDQILIVGGISDHVDTRESWPVCCVQVRSSVSFTIMLDFFFPLFNKSSIPIDKLTAIPASMRFPKNSVDL
jgi:hypothetical protein